MKIDLEHETAYQEHVKKREAEKRQDKIKEAALLLKEAGYVVNGP